MRGSTKVQVQVHACNNSVIYTWLYRNQPWASHWENLPADWDCCVHKDMQHWTLLCLCRSLWKTVNSGSMDLNDTKVFYCYMLPCFSVPVPSNKAMKVYSPFNHWAMLVRLLSYFYLQHNIHAHAPKSLNLFSQVIDAQQKCIEYYDSPSTSIQ